jgi:hypothetical protein
VIVPGLLVHRGITRPDAAPNYGLNTQHDPWRASALARRTRGDDNGLLGALHPLDLLLGLGHALLALGHFEPVGKREIGPKLLTSRSSDRLDVMHAAAVPWRADLGAARGGKVLKQARHRAGDSACGY